MKMKARTLDKATLTIIYILVIAIVLNPELKAGERVRLSSPDRFHDANILSPEEMPLFTYNISYHGNNIMNPGFNLGVEYRHGIETGSNRKGNPYIRHKHFTADIGFYINPRSHTGMYTHFGLNHRKFREGKLNFSIGFSPIGVYHAFPVKNNEVNDAEIHSPDTRKVYYSPVLSLGMGKFRNQIPATGWFFQVNFMTLLAPHSPVYPLLNTELGYRIRLGVKQGG